MNEFSRILLWCGVQASLFGLVVGVLYVFARRLGPQVGAMIAFSGLVGFTLIGTMAVSPWPRWDIDSMVGSSEPIRLENNEVVQNPDAAIAEQAAIGDLPEISAAVPTFFENFGDAFHEALRQPIAHDDSPNWMFWTGVSFLVGCVSFLAWRIIGVISVWAQVRKSREVNDAAIHEQMDILCAQLRLTSNVQLRESSELESAATVGIRTPVILLPRQWRDWDDAECRVVLSHELAHASRRDFLYWMVTQLSVVVFFYHPLVHWLSRRFRLEQELAADALAAQVAGGREEYLSHLANLALRTASPAISWPAHAFIPTRSTFLRRLEMLRRPSFRKADQLSSATAGISLSAVLAIAIVICGFRLPTELIPNNAVMAQTTGSSSPSDSSIDWRLFPVDAQFYAGVRANEIFANEKLNAITSQVNDVLKQQGHPFNVEDVDEIWIAGRDRVIVHTAGPLKVEEVVFKTLRQPSRKTHNDRAFYVDMNMGRALLVVDDRTMVVDTPKRIELLIDSLEVPGKKPDWAKPIHIESANQAAVVVNVNQLEKIKQSLDGSPATQMFAHLFTDVKKLRLQAKLTGQTEINLHADSVDEDAANRVASTVQAGMILVKNILAQQKKVMETSSNIPNEMRGHMNTIMSMIENELLANAKTTVDGATMNLTASAGEGGDTAVVVATMLPAINAAREAARRTQSINNMRHIAIAMHNFESTYGRLPSPVMLGPDGKTPHSWRVALLPFLEGGSVYEKYRLDEPWDSPHNRELLNEMPAVFRSPVDKKDSVNTSYFAMVGKDSFLGDEKPKNKENGRRFRDIRDGTSKTIAFVEANRPTPWTKPEDIRIEPGVQKRLGGWHANGLFIAARGDASVRAVANTIDEKVMQALLSANGAEPINENF